MPKREHKKHTPIVSEAQQGAMGSAYAAKKFGRGKPSKTPAAIWKMSQSELKSHLKEAGGKDLPKKVKKKNPGPHKKTTKRPRTREPVRRKTASRPRKRR